MRDDDLTRLFDRLSFHDEPVMRSRAMDDVRRGRRHLRRRRAVMFSGAAVGSAAIAAAVAVMFSAGPAQVGPSLDVADGGDRDSGVENVTIDGEALPFSVTRDTMIGLAADHLDPDAEHLDTRPPVASHLTGDTSWQVSSKLAWTNPGEDGMGMVHLIVTLPGYAAQKGAAGDVATLIGCDFTGDELVGCDYRDTADGDLVLIAEPNPDRNLLFGAMFERADGSIAAVAVHDLFGNNSVVPVSSMDVTLDQAIEFVTDPALRVDAAEAAAELARVPEEPDEARQPTSEPDFSDRELVAAPPSTQMTAQQAQGALDECVTGVTAWAGFTPVFGMWIDQKHEGRVSWVIAELGDSRMLCANGDASIFAGPDAKAKIDGKAAVDTVDSDHFGVYSEDVTKVTLQLDGQPEQEAVMHEGYWYLPVLTDQDSRVAIRGYDADNQVVHDSIAGSEAMAEPDR